jgi:GntR family trehalose operon transcriptional repressor
MPKAVFGDIYLDIKRKILDGTYAYQTFLPTEKEFVAAYSCSRNTLRRSLQMLADEAYVQPLHGKGVRVIWQPVAKLARGSLIGVESFEEYARSNGCVPSTDVILFENVTCADDLVRTTGFEAGTELVHVVRVRKLDGVSKQIDFNYFLASTVPGLTPEIASQSIYRYLEEDLGTHIVTSKRTITVQLATDLDKVHLDLGSYNCVAVLDNNAFDTNGIMVEYTETRSHPDSFRYRTVSHR